MQVCSSLFTVFSHTQSLMKMLFSQEPFAVAFKCNEYYAVQAAKLQRDGTCNVLARLRGLQAFWDANENR